MFNFEICPFTYVLDPMYQFNHLPCFPLLEWHHVHNTNRVCTTILKFASLSSNFVVLVMHLLYRWNWPRNKIQHCLTSFWIGNHFACLVQHALWLLAPYIGLYLALQNVQELPYCSCFSASLIAVHCQKPFSNLWNTATLFLMLPCPLHNPSYISGLIACPAPYPESCLLHWHFTFYVRLK